MLVDVHWVQFPIVSVVFRSCFLQPHGILSARLLCRIYNDQETKLNHQDLSLKIWVSHTKGLHRLLLLKTVWCSRLVLSSLLVAWLLVFDGLYYVCCSKNSEKLQPLCVTVVKAFQTAPFCGAVRNAVVTHMEQVFGADYSSVSFAVRSSATGRIISYQLNIVVQLECVVNDLLAVHFTREAHFQQFVISNYLLDIMQ